MTEPPRLGQRTGEAAASFRCAACGEVAGVVKAVPADVPADMGPPLGAESHRRDGIVVDYFGGTAWKLAEPGTYAAVHAILGSDQPDPAELRRIDWELAPFYVDAGTRSPTAMTRPAPVSKRFDFAEIEGVPSFHGVRAAGEARYLDYKPPDDPELAVALRLREDPWLSPGVETLALDRAVTEGMPAELARTRDIVTSRVAQVRRLVEQRLTHEINYWDMRHAPVTVLELVLGADQMTAVPDRVAHAFAPVRPWPAHTCEAS